MWALTVRGAGHATGSLPGGLHLRSMKTLSCLITGPTVGTQRKPSEPPRRPAPMVGLGVGLLAPYVVDAAPCFSCVQAALLVGPASVSATAHKVGLSTIA
jgi:hypothetical protein